MITGINESKIITKDISCECKCRFDGKTVIQINGGITINVHVRVKNAMQVKKITFEILLQVVLKMENNQQVLWMIQRLCVMKLYSYAKEKQKQFQQILMKKSSL